MITSARTLAHTKWEYNVRCETQNGAISRQRKPAGHGLKTPKRRRNKGLLLVLFFRKDHLKALL